MVVENRIKIGDFVKLTGCTLKAINYYHKIGLLPEPQRSTGGYRLYGPADLNRLRLIKRLKALGMDLKQIKEILGDLPNPRNSREVLESLRLELLNEIKTLEERLAKIDSLLSENPLHLDKDIFDSPSFQMMSDILGGEQIEKYARTSPEIFEQHRKLYGIMDDFQWGMEYENSFRALAEYFQTHSEQYRLALELGARWQELSHVSEDDPRIEAFARESAALVKGMSAVRELYQAAPGMENSFEGLFQEMVTGVLTPAQIKYREYFKKFLQSDE